MLTDPTPVRPSRRTLSLALPLMLLIAACGTAAAPSATPGQESPRATPTAVPGAGSSDGGGGGGGGGGNAGGGTEPGNPGGGIVFPIPPGPDPGDPVWGQAHVVTPQPGLVNQRPVNVQAVRAAVDDAGRATAELRWWSGVAPCNALDSVQVEKDDASRTIRLTVIEGSGQGDQMCIEIAELKATLVDLGTLSAGTWTISAEGDAPAITLEVD
jgi:hypothetical protein